MKSEQLKPEEFDAHVRNGTFRLSFVGMSNVGKSHRSKILQRELDFIWFHVDGEIQKLFGFESMDEVSTWLGQPTSEGRNEREAQYLKVENRLTKQASMQTNGKNLVFDTTGSVVHLDTSTIKVLREYCLVVHLDVREDSLYDMVEKYFKHTKPMIWRGYYNRGAGETPSQ